MKRIRLCAFVLAAITIAGCSRHAATPTRPASQSASAPGANQVDSGVRSMMGSIAHDVTHDGPAAWLKYFSAGPEFFMASEGQMAFPDAASATRTTRELATKIRHIDLVWGKDLRVDPLTPSLAVVASSWREVRLYDGGKRIEDAGFFTAVAEYREGRWLLRDAHWSVLPAPAR